MSALAGQVHNVVRPITSHHELMEVIGAVATSTSVTAVNLSRCKFSLDAAQALAASLVKSTQGHGSIHLVRLVGCNLDANMIDAISIPGACDRLEVIEVANNPIADEACPALGKIVRQSCLTLKSLDLTDCQLTAAGIKAFAPALAISPSPVLRSLVLTNNELRTPGIAILCDALRNNTSIVEVDISGNCVNCDAGEPLARLLQSNKVIQCLSVSANYLSSGAAKVLSVLAHRELPLRLLDISDNHIDDETCKASARMLNGSPIDVVCLSIQKNRITNEGFVALYHLLRRSVLQFLDVSQLQITGQSSLVVSDLIRHCESLGSVQLDGNQLGDDAVVEILYAIAQSKAVSSVNLERTGLGQRAADVIANALAKTHKMRNVNIADNPLDTLAVMRVLQGFAEAAAPHFAQQKSGNRPAGVSTSSTSAAGAGGGASSDTSLNEHLTAAQLREAPQSKLELLDLSNLPLPETENVQQALLELFTHNLQLREVTLDFCGVSVSLPNRKLTREIVDNLNAARKEKLLALASTTEEDGLDEVARNKSVSFSALAAASAGRSGLLAQSSSSSMRGGGGGGELVITSASSPTGPNTALTRRQQRVADAKAKNMHRTMHRPAWAPITTAHMRAGQHRIRDNEAGGGGASSSSSAQLISDELDDAEAEDITQLPAEPNPSSLMSMLYPSFGHGRFSSAASISSLSNPLPFNMAHGRLAQRPVWPPRGDCSHLFMQAPRRSAIKSLFSLDQLERNVGQLPVTDEQLRLKFSELDAEGAGTLPREEFIQFYRGLQGFGVPHTEREVARVMGKYLAAGNTRVTYDEFCLVMLNFAAR